MSNPTITLASHLVDALATAVQVARTIDPQNVGRDPRALIGPHGRRVDALHGLIIDLATPDTLQAVADTLDHYLDMLGYWAGDMALVQVQARDALMVALGAQPTPAGVLAFVADILKDEAHGMVTL